MGNPGDRMLQRKLLFTQPTTPTDIINCFEGNRELWLSRGQIAGRVFRRPTPVIIGMIEQLVTTQRLLKSTEPLPNGYKKFWYRLP